MTSAGPVAPPVPATVDHQPGADDGTGTTALEGRVRPALLVAVLTAVVVVPLVVGLAAHREPRWVPVLDLAQTELRVRDVGTADTPLIGLPGRIGDEGVQGSHPGPLSFYALAPVYRLLGSSSWALQVATVVVHAAAVAVALALARRRGGAVLAVAVAAGLAVLMLGYGVQTLSVPWNPYLPLLWWVVVLLATWSVLCRDWIALPVLVAAGSLAAQTHVPYLGLSLGMGATAAAGVVAAARLPGQRRRAVRFGAVGLALGVLLWTPPVVDQIVNDPGNLSVLVDHFDDPEEQMMGLGNALTVSLQRIDVGHLVVDQLAEPGTLTENSVAGRHPVRERGLVVLVVWLGAVAGAAWLRDRRLLLLHATVAAAFALGVVALSRVFGVVWYYLMLWMWGIAVLMLLATVWTAWRVVAVRWQLPPRAPRAATAFLAGLVLVTVGRLAWAAPGDEPPDRLQSELIAAVVPDTVSALESGVGAADGQAGTYLVRWYDAAFIGSQGYGLLNELEREGFEVGVISGVAAIATPHRVLEPGDATAQVVLATGVWVERWAAIPDAVAVASVDRRTAAERTRYRELRAEAIERLRRAGHADDVHRVDEGLFGLAIDESVPEDVREVLSRMLGLGVPVAVFVAPPAAGP